MSLPSHPNYIHPFIQHSTIYHFITIRLNVNYSSSVFIIPSYYLTFTPSSSFSRQAKLNLSAASKSNLYETNLLSSVGCLIHGRILYATIHPQQQGSKRQGNLFRPNYQTTQRSRSCHHHPHPQILQTTTTTTNRNHPLFNLIEMTNHHPFLNSPTNYHYYRIHHYQIFPSLIL